MSLTALQLLTEIAAAQRKTWDATAAGGTSEIPNETERFQMVTKANEALRWWWREYRPKFAWRETVDSSASVTVTDGVIPFASLGEGSGCSLWTGDPRPFPRTVQPIDCVMSEDGVHPLTTLTTVFAFYRTACPVITWAAGSSYATPANIPEACLQPVALYAAGLDLVSAGQFDQGERRMARAESWFDERRVALVNSGKEDQGMVWLQNWFVMQ